LRRLGRTRVAFLATTSSRQLLAIEAAERILAFTITWDGLPANRVEAGLALCAREEGTFAIKAEHRITQFTEERIFAINAERLAAHLADQTSASNTEASLALRTWEEFTFAIDAERLPAPLTDDRRLCLLLLLLLCLLLLIISTRSRTRRRVVAVAIPIRIHIPIDITILMQQNGTLHNITRPKGLSTPFIWTQRRMQNRPTHV
jgi:hypothetical protein